MGNKPNTCYACIHATLCWIFRDIGRTINTVPFWLDKAAIFALVAQDCPCFNPECEDNKKEMRRNE